MNIKYPAEEPAAPAKTLGMERVDKKTFFDFVGAPWNVHPRIVGDKHHQITGYVSEWRLQHPDVLVGVSDGGTTLESRYWIKREIKSKYVS